MSKPQSTTGKRSLATLYDNDEEGENEGFQSSADSEEEKTDNIVQLKKGTAATDGNAGNKNGEKPTEELLKTKKKRVTRPFNEELLLSNLGIRKIYETFPKKCRYRGKGHEREYLNNLVGLYREWSFHLHPGIALPDIVLKSKELGKKASIRSAMETLRNEERDRYLVSK
jgi:hypothetical protein